MNNTLDLLDESSMNAPVTPSAQTRNLFNLTTTQSIRKSPATPNEQEKSKNEAKSSNLTPGTGFRNYCG